jgi:hypothetical protein
MVARAVILGCPARGASSAGVEIVTDLEVASSAQLNRLHIASPALSESMRSLSDNGRANRRIRGVRFWNNGPPPDYLGRSTCHYRFKTGDTQFVAAAR